MPYDRSHGMKGGMKGRTGYSHKGGMKAGSYAGGSMDKMAGNPDSYKYSSPTARPGSNRHGFSRNPKQDSPGRQTSNPFPKPKGWTGG